MNAILTAMAKHIIGVPAIALAMLAGGCSLLFEETPAKCSPVSVLVPATTAAWTDTGVEFEAGTGFSMSPTRSTLPTFIAANGPLEGQEVFAVEFRDDTTHPLATLEGYWYSPVDHTYGDYNEAEETPPGWTGLSGVGNEKFYSSRFSGFIDTNANGSFDTGTDQYLSRWGLDMEAEETMADAELFAIESGRLYLAFLDNAHTNNKGVLEVEITCPAGSP